MNNSEFRLSPCKSLSTATMSALLWLSLSAPAHALEPVGEKGAASTQAEDNDQLELFITALIATHNFALPSSFIPDPVVGIPASAVTFATNLGLKGRKAAFFTPGDWADSPNSQGNCAFQFNLPRSEAPYSNLLGFIDLKSVPGQWGELTRMGSVEVRHANSGVNVHVRNSHVNANQTAAQTVALPPGRHTFEWRAETQISTAFDVVIPAILLGHNAIKYGAAVANLGASAASQAAMQNAARETLKAIALETGLVVASEFFETLTSATHEREQQVTIYKPLPPVISTTAPVVTLEASDFGGVLYSRVADSLRQTIQASDPCGLSFFLGNDAPALLNTGINEVTWTASDFGPLPGGGGHSVSLTQHIVIEDTQGPLLVAPPSRVIEIPAGEPGLAADAVLLGAPRVVDLADPAPEVGNDGPDFYPVDSRSPITWVATDASGNSSVANQLITIKVEGSNTAPVVSDIATETLTSQPVDIVLTGQDNDFLDDRFDPLSFRIVERPAKGEFVAPLFPFFIEDYRTPPGGPYGDDFIAAVQAGNPNQWLYQNVCQVTPGPDNLKIPLDWVHRPLFVHVTDDGLYIMIDHFFRCGPSSASRNKRISFWGAGGEYLDQIGYSGNNNTFVVDQDGFLYTLSRSGGGTGTSLVIAQRQNNINPDNPAIGGDTWRITDTSTSNPALGLDDPVEAESLSYARVDTRQGLLYVTDRRRVFVFDVLGDLSDGVPKDNNNMNPLYRGALNGGARFLCTTSGTWGNDWTGFAMDVDPDGNLYVADSCSDRIHKFTATTRNEDGAVVHGDYVGWLGRCETSTNNACDEEKQTSKGYSCTDATCSVGSGAWAGSGNGQFSELEFITLDPNGVLYATDEGDPDTGGRVQRFGTDGSFGGVARSTGTGINQGDQPGFVLGNLGTVRAVSVNSTQFFVVDQQESFLHVFETSPLKDITDVSATVTYVSNFDFHSATDSFRFVASDGLADSNTGTAFIDVSRNFRAPVAMGQHRATLENQPLDITLTAFDPDGVIGVDFNGLDILSYDIVAEPAHGSLSLLGSDNATATFTYTPAAGFFGSDSFQFVANDGVDDSEPAQVSIEVTYVDDPPQVIDLRVPPRVGLGFPVTIVAEFEDDGALGYSVAFLAGDGSPAQTEGGIVEEPGQARLDGVILIAPPLGVGRGSVVAQHTYNSVGPHSLSFCIADNQGREDCRQLSVAPEALVSLGLSLPDGSPEPITAGASFFVDVNIENLLPADGMAGAPAEAVAMQGTLLGGGVTFVGSSEGSCQITNAGLGLLCSLGDLAVGEMRSLRLHFASDESIPDDVISTINLDFSTATPAVNELMSISAVRIVKSNVFFRNGFESE